MTSIFLADDHEIVRRGLSGLLAGERDLQVVGEAADGPAAIAGVMRLRPDVLVLDLMLPGMTGFEVARTVTERAPSTRVLILSMHADQTYVRQAGRCGARGYVVKDAAAEQLVHAIREVAQGRRCFGPENFESRSDDAAIDRFEQLTPREREVVVLAADGYGNLSIAERLGISSRTVEVHRARALHKLGIASQTELVRYAIRRGLVALG